MAKVNLALLGGLRLQTDSGEPVSLSTRKAAALLAYLALHPGRAQPRAKLAALLWGESGEMQARDSLRQALSLVRKALLRVDSRALIAHEDTVSFEPTALTTDAIVFGADLVSQADTGRLEEAIALYGGEFLDGFQVRAPEFERWVTTERERFRELAVQAMIRLLDHHLSTGTVEPGVRIAARLLSADPLQERAHRILMELYYRQGRYAAALRQYQSCAELLEKELGIEPDAATKALRREIVRKWNKPRDATSGDDVAPTPLGDLEPESPAVRPTLALPDKPSIAVLPFQNMSGDPEQEYFADGMVEEIITALSRTRWLFVIARNSSFTYKGRTVDVKQVGRELGVRYVLEGSIRKAGNRVRIACQLIDAVSDAHLWADRFDGSLDDVFDLQDKIAASVVGVIEPAVIAAEIRGSIQRQTTGLTVYDLYLRARADAMSWEKSRLLRALDLLQHALEFDPYYGPALALAAQCRQNLHQNGWSEHLEKERQQSVELAHRAIQASGDDPYVLGEAAFVIGYFEHEIDPAVVLIDRSLELNPSSATGWFRSGWLRLWAGQLDLGIEHFENSRRLNPLRPAPPSFGIAVGHFFAGRLERAIVMLRLSLQENPTWPPCYRFLASCCAHLGLLDEAREIVKRLRDITLSVIPGAEHWRVPEQREFFLEGLRLAAGEKK